MSRRTKPRAESWFLDLEEEVRMLAADERAKAITERVGRVAELHGLDPWELAARIARYWLERGWIKSLIPGEVAWQ